ncbi:hypothetical protein [Wenxinia saemankumensis]|uniref:Uncharacterized protein n=1 Tax=Wenxinia saemankumensis TaxID=1447782 RepID=A0A1M6H2U6_9RHOB|nr:hypothetical protein [Wenxinia saemankumensis]SHJ16520.1 hypothetical protein SAMN05444417_3075 [Wenxinia saemankumensis]
MADWDEADLFAVPLLDGGIGIGQVAAPAGAEALVALSILRADPGRPLAGDEVAAILRVAPDALESGHWRILRLESLPRPRSIVDPAQAGTAPHDPAIAEALLNALAGQLPWDYFPGDFLAGLLRPNFSR